MSGDISAPMEFMKAGRELDAAVAEKVMGWRREPGCAWWIHADDRAHGELTDRWSPSTSIADAWQVVEKSSIDAIIRMDDGRWVSVRNFTGDYTYYEVSLYPNDNDGTFGDTAPHAICLAALAASGAKPISDPEAPSASTPPA